MNNSKAFPTPVFLPVLEESEEKQDKPSGVLLSSFDAYRYQYESVRRACLPAVFSLNN